ncbi:peptidyl-prolyl cis-trans isomerase [Pseudomonas sp. N040]|uniref:peptidylprolyl isomerase n=1 Tax=Pseudomonas sp. N040 TaxID=2785325 RepID=UPI0018A2A104|nr:peptidylprolyl isomerase [Pseudomonas sp. N040]MBF7731386.1 peptidyl-prolyl cis-trans isomerase [Pseudomonas sp. N040]MBW7015029.1 peptidyl-prolyl cis-trans isomerase [Pseudomonas sp. N040]
MTAHQSAPVRRHAWLRRLLGEPFLQFIVLGALIFVVNARFGVEAAATRIDIDAQDWQRLAAMAQKQWGKPATAEELQDLVQQQIREEVLYREALASGLQTDDVIVRRRLVQKMEFLAQSDVPLPTEDEVLAFYKAHPERFGAPAELSFRQLYFKDPAAAEQALAQLRADPQASVSGERLMLPEHFVAQSQAMAAREFGAAFAAQLFELPVGQWSAPLRSPFGVHLVRVERHEPAQLLEYATIRDKVAAELTAQRQQEARDAAYAALRSRYQIHIEPLAEAAAP